MSCSRAAIVNISSILGSIEVAEAWEDRQDVCYRCSKVLTLGELGGIWGGVTSYGIPPTLHHWPWHCQPMMIVLPPALAPQAALNMLTKCLALEYGSSGILCVSVDPGCVTPPLGRGTVSVGRCTATLPWQSPTGIPSHGYTFPGAYLPRGFPSYGHP